MEKIKKYGYYLFIYALFAFWLFYFSQFLLLGIFILIDFINSYIKTPTTELLFSLIVLIILGPIAMVFYCLALRYFMKIKNKETAKIKDVILAVIFTCLGFLLGCTALFSIFLDLF